MATPTGTKPAARPRGTRDLQALKAELQQRLAELHAETGQASAVMADLQRGWQDEPTGDLIDTVARAFACDAEHRIAENRRHRIQQIEHALQRLADGTYGRCEQCGTDIPAARLRAFPAATLCVTCKSEQEH